MKLDDYNLEAVASQGGGRGGAGAGGVADSVWLDLGGGMEPEDQGWEAVIQSLRQEIG